MIDQRNQDLYDEVNSVFADVHLHQDARDVIGRGRTVRRRRRTVPALAVTGLLALSLGLVTVARSGGTSNDTAVNVEEAAFSVHTDAKTGDVTVTIRQMADQAELKEILDKAGIRSAFGTITSHSADNGIESCTWPGARKLDPTGIFSVPHNVGGALVITIDPARMPHGSVLGFSYFTGPMHGDVVVVSSSPSGGDRPTSHPGTIDIKAITPALLSGEPAGCNS